MTIAIRAERAGDQAAVSALITSAFAGAAHASGEEAAIVERLRADGDLTLALVAVKNEPIIGQVAFSPVTIDGAKCGWYGLGPVAVAPERQRGGIGAALIERGLSQLEQNGAGGCVVLGDPAYYSRFGFGYDAQLEYPGVPPEYFQRLVFRGPAPGGIVSYARAFG